MMGVELFVQVFLDSALLSALYLERLAGKDD